MTQQSLLSSPSITNLDASPPSYTLNTTGEHAPGFLQFVGDWVTCLNGDDNTSIYRMVRIPTTAKVKKVRLLSDVATAGSADIEVAYSDSTTDGTVQANLGAIVQVSAADNKLFASAFSLVAAEGTNEEPLDVTWLNTFTPAMSCQPLWAALGLSVDPGGMFDIIIRVTTGVTTGSILYLSCEYVV